MTDYRIRIGSEVRSRLLANPSAFKIPSNDLDIFVVRDFLSQAECDRLIRLIDANRIPSQLLSPTTDPEFRTSESCNLDPDEPIVELVEAKITALMGIDPAHGETIQGQRYAVGQQFKPHHDFFHPAEPYWPEMERTGGQRTWTAMIFLNAPEGGGQTVFEQSGSRSRPRRATCSPGTISTRSASPIPIRSTRACRSPPGSNTSSPNGIASGPGCRPTSRPIERVRDGLRRASEAL